MIVNTDKLHVHISVPRADLNKAELSPAERSSHRGERRESQQHVEEEAQDPQHVEGVGAPRLRVVKVKRGGFVVLHLGGDRGTTTVVNMASPLLKGLLGGYAWRWLNQMVVPRPPRVR